MRVRVEKWGDSLELRIPPSLAAETRIEQGTEVDLVILEGKLTISLVTPPGITLDHILDHVKPENLHAEFKTEPAVGAEEWS